MHFMIIFLFPLALIEATTIACISFFYDEPPLQSLLLNGCWGYSALCGAQFKQDGPERLLLGCRLTWVCVVLTSVQSFGSVLS